MLPARGCGARKCIKTSGPLDGLNIHQHLGGQVKQIYAPDLYVRLRHGGALELSVCQEDKIQILRAVLLSLELDPVAKMRAKRMISLIEEASKKEGSGEVCPVRSSPQIATSVDQKRTLAGRDGLLPVNHTTIGEPT